MGREERSGGGRSEVGGGNEKGSSPVRLDQWYRGKGTLTRFCRKSKASDSDKRALYWRTMGPLYSEVRSPYSDTGSQCDSSTGAVDNDTESQYESSRASCRKQSMTLAPPAAPSAPPQERTHGSSSQPPSQERTRGSWLVQPGSSKLLDDMRMTSSGGGSLQTQSGGFTTTPPGLPCGAPQGTPPGAPMGVPEGAPATPRGQEGRPSTEISRRGGATLSDSPPWRAHGVRRPTPSCTPLVDSGASSPDRGHQESSSAGAQAVPRGAQAPECPLKVASLGAAQRCTTDTSPARSQGPLPGSTLGTPPSTGRGVPSLQCTWGVPGSTGPGDIPLRCTAEAPSSSSVSSGEEYQDTSPLMSCRSGAGGGGTHSWPPPLCLSTPRTPRLRYTACAPGALGDQDTPTIFSSQGNAAARDPVPEGVSSGVQGADKSQESDLPTGQADFAFKVERFRSVGTYTGATPVPLVLDEDACGTPQMGGSPGRVPVHRNPSAPHLTSRGTSTFSPGSSGSGRNTHGVPPVPSLGAGGDPGPTTMSKWEEWKERRRLAGGIPGLGKGTNTVVACTGIPGANPVSPVSPAGAMRDSPRYITGEFLGGMPGADPVSGSARCSSLQRMGVPEATRLSPDESSPGKLCSLPPVSHGGVQAGWSDVSTCEARYTSGAPGSGPRAPSVATVPGTGAASASAAGPAAALGAASTGIQGPRPVVAAAAGAAVLATSAGAAAAAGAGAGDIIAPIRLNSSGIDPPFPWGVPMACRGAHRVDLEKERDRGGQAPGAPGRAPEGFGELGALRGWGLPSPHGTPAGGQRCITPGAESRGTPGAGHKGWLGPSCARGQGPCLRRGGAPIGSHVVRAPRSFQGTGCQVVAGSSGSGLGSQRFSDRHSDSNRQRCTHSDGLSDRAGGKGGGREWEQEDVPASPGSQRRVSILPPIQASPLADNFFSVHAPSTPPGEAERTTQRSTSAGARTSASNSAHFLENVSTPCSSTVTKSRAAVTEQESVSGGSRRARGSILDLLQSTCKLNDPPGKGCSRKRGPLEVPASHPAYSDGGETSRSLAMTPKGNIGERSHSLRVMRCETFQGGSWGGRRLERGVRGQSRSFLAHPGPAQGTPSVAGTPGTPGSSRRCPSPMRPLSPSILRPFELPEQARGAALGQAGCAAELPLASQQPGRDAQVTAYPGGASMEDAGREYIREGLQRHAKQQETPSRAEGVPRVEGVPGAEGVPGVEGVPGAEGVPGVDGVPEVEPGMGQQHAGVKGLEATKGKSWSHGDANAQGEGGPRGWAVVQKGRSTSRGPELSRKTKGRSPEQSRRSGTGRGAGGDPVSRKQRKPQAVAATVASRASQSIGSAGEVQATAPRGTAPRGTAPSGESPLGGFTGSLGSGAVHPGPARAPLSACRLPKHLGDKMKEYLASDPLSSRRLPDRLASSSASPAGRADSLAQKDVLPASSDRVALTGKRDKLAWKTASEAGKSARLASSGLFRVPLYASSRRKKKQARRNGNGGACLGPSHSVTVGEDINIPEFG